jgi:hypothetical protein
VECRAGKFIAAVRHCPAAAISPGGPLDTSTTFHGVQLPPQLGSSIVLGTLEIFLGWFSHLNELDLVCHFSESKPVEARCSHNQTGNENRNFQSPRIPLSRGLRSPRDDQNVRFDKGNVAVVIKSRSDARLSQKRAKFLSPGESNPALSRDRGRCYRYTRRDAALLRN